MDRRSFFATLSAAFAAPLATLGIVRPHDWHVIRPGQLIPIPEHCDNCRAYSDLVQAQEMLKSFRATLELMRQQVDGRDTQHWQQAIEELSEEIGINAVDYSHSYVNASKFDQTP